MSYLTQAKLAQDHEIVPRIAACVTVETDVPDPQFWVQGRMWQFSALPGWADAWSSALASGVEHPGVDESVITDGDILSGVQSIRSAEAADEPAE